MSPIEYFINMEKNKIAFESYIDQCNSLYLKTFKNESWRKPSKETRERVDKLNEFKEFEKKCFVLLSKSALSGEYIRIDDFINKLKDFQEGLYTIDYTYPKDDESEEIDEELAIIKKLTNYFVNLNNHLSNALKQYKQLIVLSINHIEEKLEEREIIWGIKLSKTKQPSILDDFCSLVLELCRLNYRPFETDSLATLMSISLSCQDRLKDKEWTNGSEMIIYKTLDIKTNFYLPKIGHKEFKYSRNFDKRKVFRISGELDELEIFYQLENRPTALSEGKIKEYLEEVQMEHPKMKYFVVLARFYKETLSINCKEDLFVFDKFVKNYDEFIESVSCDTSSILGKYNKFALSSITHYIYNCRFSYFTKFDFISYDELHARFDEVQNIHNENGLNNFHPYAKALNAYIRMMKLDVKLRFNEKKDEVKICLKKCDAILEKLTEAFLWCKTMKYYPFLLPYDESCLKLFDEITVFIPSTFARPIDYSKSEEIISNYRLDLKEIRTLISVSEKIQAVDDEINANSKILDEIKKENTRLSLESIKNKKDIVEELDKSHKKNFEVLGVFATIVTFLFGAINIFIPNHKEGEKILDFMLTSSIWLGFVLLLFISVLMTLSPYFLQQRKFKDLRKSPRFWILIGLIISVMILIVFFSTGFLGFRVVRI